MIKKVLNKIILAIGIFLMLGIMIIPDLRDIIGKMVGTILNPLLTLLPLHIIIFVLAAITGLYASLIQKYTMDWELMKRVQERMKNIQKDFKEAQLSNNAQKMKKLEAQRVEMMGDQMEMFKQQFKPMLYISIISIPLFFWAYSIIIPGYLFSWDEVPGNDNGKLINFFEKNLGAGWAKKATIANDGNMITVTEGERSLSLVLNAEKTWAILKFDDSRTYEFPVKTENGRLSVYTPAYSMVFPFWGKHKLTDKVFWEIQYWLFWYFLCSIPISQITRKALNIGGM